MRGCSVVYGNMELEVLSFTLIMLNVLVANVSSSGHFENVALNKASSMSSLWDSKRLAGAAVNGNTGGTWGGTNNCIHSASGDRTPWWEVNLGRPYPVFNITVWARSSLVKRMKDCVITVDGEECYRFSNAPPNRKSPITCTRGVLNGTIIRVSKNNTQSSDGSTINMCEFQVFSCSDAYWGSGCTRKCGHCSDGEVCDKVTGNCSICCVGWVQPLCDQECANGTYGQNCTQTCSEGCDDVCNKVTGSCSCVPGWNGTLCDSACPPGTHGINCTQNCSLNCDGICDKATGHCTCKPGFKTSMCTEECDGGRYGRECRETCGQCEGDEVCHHVNGNCSACSGDFMLPLCKVKAMASTRTPSTGVLAGSVAGAVVALLAVAAVVILVVRRRRAGSKDSMEQDVHINEPFSSQPVQDDTIYQNVANTPKVMSTESPGKPQKKARPKPAKAVKQKSTKKNTPSSSTSYVNVDLRSKDNNPVVYIEQDFNTTTKAASKVARTQSTETEAEEEVEEVEVEGAVDAGAAHQSVYYNDDVYMTSEGARLKLDSIQQHLLNKLSGDDMAKEFKALPEGLVKAHDSGSKDENYYRNRFTSILPYEDTRVVLRGDPDPGSNDYINASYVTGQRSTKAYIAAQGPRPNTVGDFWKMVWQDHVVIIVMLTNVKEGKKRKCAEYWPDSGTKQRYGSVDVTGLQTYERAHYVKRTFEVKAGDGETRYVTQYHYTTWPDHGIPTATALVDFWRTVRTSYRNLKSPAPLLVHCSAGVGRTGTFIALDILMDRVEHQEQVDVFEVVKNMRNDRCNMVQTKSQYCVLHEALLEAYTSQDCRLPVSLVDSVLRLPVDPHHSNQPIDIQFQKLKQMRVLLNKPSHTEAEREENTNKNRYMDVLPGDDQVVHLTLPVPGRNYYINAVCLTTAGKQRSFILTQLPLPDTVVDLWRLVAGSDVSMIVSLGGETDGFERTGCYWPRKKGQCMTLGPVSVRLTSLSSLGQHLKQYSLSLQSPKEAHPRELQLLHYEDWKGDIAGSVQDLVQLVDIVLSTTPPPGQDSPPVVVQCSNGATKSGLFCAICDAVSRMTSDGEIDVYMAVRNVHIVRPESVTSQVQYRFIYRVLQEYTERNVYQNTSFSDC